MPFQRYEATRHLVETATRLTPSTAAPHDRARAYELLTLAAQFMLSLALGEWESAKLVLQQLTDRFNVHAENRRLQQQLYGTPTRTEG